MRFRILTVPFFATLALSACAKDSNTGSGSSEVAPGTSSSVSPTASGGSSAGAGTAGAGTTGAGTTGTAGAGTAGAGTMGTAGAGTAGAGTTSGTEGTAGSGTADDGAAGSEPGAQPGAGTDLETGTDNPVADDAASTDDVGPADDGASADDGTATDDSSVMDDAAGADDGASGMGGAGGADDATTDDAAMEELSGICPYAGGVEASGQNWVGGELIEFNDNGGWCWYQDERVIVDQAAGKMIIGSVASGGNRERRVEVTHWDLATGQSQLHHIGTVGYTDDHDVPAVIQRPDGGYAAMWAGHNDDCNSYYNVFNGNSWSSAASFAWPECPTPSGKRITYANLFYLGDRLYSYVRSIDTSPHYLYSDDHGASWDLGGRLTSTPQVGYVAGYYKYWGNNVDRLDFFGTEAHPRDNDNSLYHGYVKDGKIHDSLGQVIDDNFEDRQAQEVTSYTRVFAKGTSINGVTLEHMWNADLMRYDDGTIAAIGSGRVAGTGSDDPDKRLLYFRFDGTEWKTTYLAKAGTKLYSSEQDYTGLGALHPDNPHVIYISTPYDPRTDQGTNNGKKEIWKGVTCDDGATFDWEPVTANSQMDNLRPIVPKWDASHTALLWLRGSYSTAQSYNLAVVGLIEEH